MDPWNACRRMRAARAGGMVVWALAIAVGIAGGDEPAAPAKAPEAVGALVGQVLVRGTPAAAMVEVRARTEDGAWAFEPAAPIASARSDDRGSFRVEGVPAGRYEVRAIVPGMAAGYATATVAGGFDVEVPIVVAGGDARLTGRVTWDDGTPFRGIVERSPGWRMDRPYARTEGATYSETDAEGRFAFEGVAPGLARMTAIVPGSFRGMLREARAPAEGREFVAAPEWRRLRGRVLDPDDKPVALARVRAGSWSGSMSVATDADGRFEIRMPDGAERLSVEAAGFARAKVPLGFTQDGIDVRLSRGATVTGRVTGPGEIPVAGIAVVASLDTGDGDPSVRSTETDSDGRYRLDALPPGEPLVAAIGLGWVSEELGSAAPSGDAKGADKSLRVRLDPAGNSTRDLKVVRAPSARVRVRDSEGRPVPFALVVLSGSGPFAAMWSEAVGRSGRSGLGGADGVVEFGTLLPGTKNTLRTWAQGFAPVDGTPLDAGSVSAAPVEVTLPVPRWAEVIVLDDVTGQPVPDAVVTTGPRSRGEWWWPQVGERRLTDAAGRASVGPLPPGDPAVSVEAGGKQSVRNVPLAATPPTIVRLAPARTIAGRVSGPPGIGGRPIELRFERLAPRNAPWVPETRIEVAAGETFRSPGLDGDEFLLTARVRFHGVRYEGQVRAQPGREDVEIPLTGVPLHEVRLKVLDPAGKPVPRAAVSVQASMRGWRQVVARGSVVSGDYRCEVDRSVGEVTVEVREAADDKGQDLPLAATDVGPLVPGEQTVEVKLKPERRLSGTVRERAGKPLPGAVVSAYPARSGGGNGPDPEIGEDAHAEATSGKDGKFSLGRLGDSAYEIRVTVPEDYAAPDPLSVAKNDKKAVDVKVEAGLRALLTFSDPAGKPIGGARVYLWWRGKGWRRWAHDENPIGWSTYDDGSVVFKGLMKDRAYELQVEPPSSRKDLGSIRVDPWAPKDGDFRFPAARRLAGIVRDHGGKPLADFPVATWVRGDPNRRTTRTDADGRFWFDPDRAKTVLVAPDLEPMTGDREKGAKEVAADDASVVLTVDDRRMIRLTLKEATAGLLRAYVGAQGCVSQDLRPGSVAYFVGLDSQRDHAIYVGPTADGKFFHREGVKPGGAPIEVSVAAGIVVRGRLSGGPKVLGPATLSVNGRGLAIEAQVAPDGTFSLPPLPDGSSWTLVAGAAGKTGKADVKVSAGLEVDVKLR